MKTNLKKMTLRILIGIVGLSFNTNTAVAQTKNLRPKMAVMTISSNCAEVPAWSVANMVRTELEKLDTFNIMDAEDVTYVIQQKKLNANCRGRLCLVELGNALDADYVFTGSIEKVDESFIFTFKLLDVKASEFSLTKVNEYLYLPREIRNMTSVTITEMFGKTADAQLKKSLSKRYNYENAVNTPEEPILVSSGPRMGFIGYSGSTAERIMAPKAVGGFDNIPFMFQFGYQFERAYLNEGRVQALFEFVPMITGLDQGRFIPSFSIMHGLRNNRSGWEFAFGPSISVVRMADVYRVNNVTYLEHQWNDTLSNPYPITSQLDSRGTPRLTSSFVFGFGKTFKSGNLNIPVNIFVIPSNKGCRFGASFGFNARNRTNVNKKNY
ncbi:MAG: hypothetical protein V2A54_14260 [Bacteroidota bacterium]